MIEIIKETIKNAGEMVKEGFSKPKEIKEKAGLVDLVTEYDVMVEDYLKEVFKEYFPDFTFIGEEAGDLEKYKEDKGLKNYFVVDPIDGTSNFVKGFPYVSISIGVYKDGEPYYGIVYNPIMNELYEAIAGSGESFCNGELIQVSKRPQEEQIKSIYLSSRRLNPPRLEVEILKKLENEYVERRIIHSAALELCYIAKGVYGIYATNKISPWDIAAGVIILKEAGGSSTDLFGKELDILKTSNIKSISRK